MSNDGSIDTSPGQSAATESAAKADASVRFDQIELRLDQGALRMQAFETALQKLCDELKANTEATKSGADAVEVIRDVMVAGRVGLKVLGGIGVVVKWLGIIAAGALSIYAALYALTHGGSPPHP